MSAPAQSHYGVLRDSITSILHHLSVGLMWPPGWFHFLLIVSKSYWDQHTIDDFGNSAEGQWSAIGSEKSILNLRIIQIRV